jgi:hypothetical protein
MARSIYRLGSTANTRFTEFSNEFLMTPITAPSLGVYSGAVGEEFKQPVRMSQFALFFLSSSSGTIRMRMPNSLPGTDGYADDQTKTARGEERDYPNIPKFGGDRFYYGFSKGDTARTSFYAGGNDGIYARRGQDVFDRQLYAEFYVDTVPGPVTGLGLSVQGPDSIYVAWNAPSDTGGIPLSGYSVFYRQSGTSTWNFASAPGRFTTNTTISGLSADTTYEVAVGARNNISKAHGGSNTSPSYHTGRRDTASATTASLVSKPENSLGLTNATQTSFDIRWEVSNNPTSVQVSVSNGSVFYSSSGNETISGLTPNTTYSVTITSSNSAGSDTDSNTITTLLPTPTLTMSAEAIDSTSARVIWNSENASSVTVTGTNLNSSSLSGNEIVENLEPGEIYFWSGTASNRDSSTEAQTPRIQLPNIIGGVWNGSEWGLPAIKRWNGSSWGSTEVRVWTGSEWKLWA